MTGAAAGVEEARGGAEVAGDEAEWQRPAGVDGGWRRLAGGEKRLRASGARYGPTAEAAMWARTRHVAARDWPGWCGGRVRPDRTCPVRCEVVDIGLGMEGIRDFRGGAFI